MEYDSEDTMIEFIKVECGTNQDGDPFISNVVIDDNELFQDGMFEEVSVRKKPHTKQTPNIEDKTGRNRASKCRGKSKLPKLYDAFLSVQ